MTNTYTPIASVTLSASAAEVVFSSIPATFRDLVLVGAGGTSVQAGVQLRLNGDAGTNYFRVTMAGDGANAFSFAESSQAEISIGFWSNSICNVIAHIQDYSATDKHKTVLARGNGQNDGGARATAGRWANTAAVNALRVFSSTGTFNSGTTISLFGIVA